MYAPNQILFPVTIIPLLRDLRGPEWAALVDRVLSLPESHEEVLGFMFMMINFNNCLECETDSFRAMRGCDLCALQMLRRYKGSDRDLLALYQTALEEVRNYLARNQRYRRFPALGEPV